MSYSEKEVTKNELDIWKKNKNINPRTKRKIKKNSKIYKYLDSMLTNTKTVESVNPVQENTKVINMEQILNKLSMELEERNKENNLKDKKIDDMVIELSLFETKYQEEKKQWNLDKSVFEKDKQKLEEDKQHLYDNNISLNTELDNIKKLLHELNIELEEYKKNNSIKEEELKNYQNKIVSLSSDLEYKSKQIDILLEENNNKVGMLNEEIEQLKLKKTSKEMSIQTNANKNNVENKNSFIIVSSFGLLIFGWIIKRFIC